MTGTYSDFLSGKTPAVVPCGFEPDLATNAPLFPFQRAMVEWACRRGRAAIFADTGLGKTNCELHWSHEVVKRTGGRVLILAPLAVASQTAAEAVKFGVPNVNVIRAQDEAREGISIANYEILHKLDPSAYAGVVLDESSILKSFMGKTKRALVDSFASTTYKLACTATPAPNDHLELGNHSEFLGVLSSHQMIARWFINDTSTFGTYRLKRHASRSYWDWVSGWARCVGKPSDLDSRYDDSPYTLPPMNLHRHVCDVDMTVDRGGSLFRQVDLSATSVHKEKRRTSAARAAKVAELVSAELWETWLIWVDTDYDADAVCDAVPGAVEVRGSDSVDEKTSRLVNFSEGRIRALVTKPSIAGFGLNWQHCARVAFAGPGFSYEQFYQAARRCWRFGQTRPVDCHVVMSETETGIWDAVSRKADGHESMKAEMFAASRRAQHRNATSGEYSAPRKAHLPHWLTEHTT